VELLRRAEGPGARAGMGTATDADTSSALLAIDGVARSRMRESSVSKSVTAADRARGLMMLHAVGQSAAAIRAAITEPADCPVEVQ